jgi:hypothetical protein
VEYVPEEGKRIKKNFHIASKPLPVLPFRPVTKNNVKEEETV